MSGAPQANAANAVAVAQQPAAVAAHANVQIVAAPPALDRFMQGGIVFQRVVTTTTTVWLPDPQQTAVDQAVVASHVLNHRNKHHIDKPSARSVKKVAVAWELLNKLRTDMIAELTGLVQTLVRNIESFYLRSKELNELIAAVSQYIHLFDEEVRQPLRNMPATANMLADEKRHAKLQEKYNKLQSMADRAKAAMEGNKVVKARHDNQNLKSDYADLEAEVDAMDLSGDDDDDDPGSAADDDERGDRLDMKYGNKKIGAKKPPAVTVCVCNTYLGKAMKCQRCKGVNPAALDGKKDPPSPA